jgi:hypothetical protein
MRAPHRSITPPDRRASRLLSLSQRPDTFGGADISGLEALGVVVLTYGPDRLAGAGDRRISDRALRDAVRRIADEARAKDAARAERMLITLKATWTQLPAVQRCGETRVRAALWDRLVRIGCEEFYAPVDAVPLRLHDSAA